MKTKICIQCKKEFPETNEYFYKQTKGGFSGRCKTCQKEYGITYRSVNKEKIQEKDKIYYQENKNKVISRQTKYYYKNSENYKEYYKENRSDILDYQKEYKSKNPELIKEIGKRRDNKRKILKIENGGFYTEEEWNNCLSFFDYKCCYSGQILTDKNISIEHIIPIIKGGINNIYNIVCCDTHVNSSKGSKDMEDWYREQEFFSEQRLQKIYEWIEINIK